MANIGAKVEEYLGPLLDYAKEYVPEGVLSSTPLQLLATAGMRKLKKDYPEDYEELCDEIKGFIVGSAGIDPTKIKIKLISGKDEAVYGWVSANYTEGRFKQLGERTYGFMEMGGESLQIAYRPTEDEKSDYKGKLTRVKMSWGGRSRLFDLFTETWLGLGVDGAWRRHLKDLSDRAIEEDPCLLNGSYSLIDRGGKKCLEGSNDGEGLPPHPDGLPTEERTVQGICKIRDGLRMTNLLLGCKTRSCTDGTRPCILMGKSCLLKSAPSLGFDDSRRHFVGGAVFWHATRWTLGDETNSYSYIGLLGDLDRAQYTPWEFSMRANITSDFEELAELEGLAIDEPSRRRRNKKAAGIRKKQERLRKSLFATLLVHSTLYDGFGLPSSTAVPDEANPPRGTFQPFNGIIRGNERIPYSWTLGRAVLLATGDFPTRVLTRGGWGPCQDDDSAASDSEDE